MKTLFLTTILFFLSIFSYGQMAVVDAGVNASLTSQIATASKQLVEAQKSYELLEKSADKIEKVSQAIKSVAEIGEFLQMQSTILKNLSQASRNKNISQDKVNKILNGTQRSIKGVQNLLSNSFFSLNDKERLDLLKEEKESIQINMVRSSMLLNASK